MALGGGSQLLPQLPDFKVFADRHGDTPGRTEWASGCVSGLMESPASPSRP